MFIFEYAFASVENEDLVYVRVSVHVSVSHYERIQPDQQTQHHHIRLDGVNIYTPHKRNLAQTVLLIF